VLVPVAFALHYAEAYDGIIYVAEYLIVLVSTPLFRRGVVVRLRCEYCGNVYLVSKGVLFTRAFSNYCLISRTIRSILI
jgi:hypothetical protein